jgi:hypothetical protein
MTKADAWFLSERAERQAILLWTTLPLLVAREESPDEGIDLRIIADGETSHPIEFGVQVKGALSLSKFLLGKSSLRQSVRAELVSQARRYKMPVCLMLVQVRTLETYWVWLTLPKKGSTGEFVPAPERQVTLASKESLTSAIKVLRDAYDRKTA